MATLLLGFPCGSVGKESSYNAGDLGLIPGFDPWVGKIPGEGKDYPLQYSGLENSVHGVAKSQTHLSNFHFFTLEKHIIVWSDTGIILWIS